MRSSLLLSLLLVAGVGAGPRPEGTLVERILAVVDERPLLLSEVRALQAVRGLDRAEALRASIDEHLMYQEASRLPQAAVAEEDVDRAVRGLLEAQPDLGGRVTASALRRLARRELAILKYVEFRFRPQIRITEDALRETWNEDYRGQPEGPPFEEAVPELRARLERQALDQRIEDWVRDLRDRADVRYVDGPGSPPRPPDVGP